MSDKKTKRYFLVLSLILPILNLSIITGYCNLDVKLVDQDPYPAKPGEYIELFFQIEGSKNPSCNNIVFKPNITYPFIMIEKDEIKTLTNKSFKNAWTIPYKLLIDKNATEENYKIKVNYGHDSKLTESKEIDIKVLDPKTDFNVILQGALGSTISLSIINIGKYDAGAMIIKIPKQEGIQVLGKDSIMMGILEKGDSVPINLEIKAEEAINLKIEIHYTDNIGERRIQIGEVPLNPATEIESIYITEEVEDYWEKQEEKKEEIMEVAEKKMENLMLFIKIILITIFVSIVFFIFRKIYRKKKKKKNALNWIKKYRKTKHSILLIFIAILLISNSVISSSCSIQIDILYQNPIPANQGEEMEITFQIEGIAHSGCKGAVFKLNPSYPFSFLLDSDNELKKISRSTENNRWTIPYKLKINENAINGNYTLQVVYGQSELSTVTKDFKIQITNPKTEFEVLIDKISPSVSIILANIGKNDAKGIIAKIPKQEGITVTGADSQIMGNLKKGDAMYIDVPMINNGAEYLELEIHYTDNIGERRIHIIKIPLDSDGESYQPGDYEIGNDTEDIQKEKGSMSWIKILSRIKIIAIVIVMIILIRHFYNKKNPNRHLISDLIKKVKK